MWPPVAPCGPLWPPVAPRGPMFHATIVDLACLWSVCWPVRSVPHLGAAHHSHLRARGPSGPPDAEGDAWACPGALTLTTEPHRM